MLQKKLQDGVGGKGGRQRKTYAKTPIAINLVHVLPRTATTSVSSHCTYSTCKLPHRPPSPFSTLPLLASLCSCCLHIAGGSFSLLVNNKSLRRICVSNERGQRGREMERGEVWQWVEGRIVDSLSCVCICVL